MTTPLADGDPHTLNAATIGAAWLAVARRIIADGIASRYDDLPVREISLVTLAIDRPDPADEIIARYGEPGRLAWMHANFTSRSQVEALGDADSYATRLFDYEHSGRDQIAWVIDRLRRDPATRSAVITTLQRHVAGELGLPAGRLLMTVKSAHIYETELPYMHDVLRAEPNSNVVPALPPTRLQTRCASSGACGRLAR